VRPLGPLGSASHDVANTANVATILRHVRSTVTEKAHLADMAEWWNDVFDRSAAIAKSKNKDMSVLLAVSAPCGCPRSGASGADD